MPEDQGWLEISDSEKVPIKIGEVIIVRYAIGGRDIPDYYSRRKITVPAKEKIPIEGLLESYEAALTQTGYSITTRLVLHPISNQRIEG